MKDANMKDVVISARVSPDTRQKIDRLIRSGYGRSIAEVITKLVEEKHSKMYPNE
jgi:Arc/MetJ-type ribon-helix-helix transcriptional regulator